MSTKISFIAISLLMGVLGIIKLNRLPSSNYSPNGNYWRICIYSTIGGLIDIIMIVIIIGNCPREVVLPDIGIIMFLGVLVFYGIPCVIVSRRLKQRMIGFNNDAYDVTKINALNVSAIMKAVFAIFETIWLLEVK